MDQEKKVLASFDNLKIIKKEVDIDRDTIEEDCWSYKRDCHYTRTVGYYNILNAEIKFGGRLFLPDKFLFENDADKNCLPKFIEGWFNEDLPKCICNEINNNWEFDEEYPKYKILRCQEHSPEHYDIEITFEACGTRNCEED